jgi:hypothetical protein
MTARRIIARGLDGLRVVVTVDRIATAARQRRRGVGAKHLEGAAHDLAGRDDDTAATSAPTGVFGSSGRDLQAAEAGGPHRHL